MLEKLAILCSIDAFNMIEDFAGTLELSKPWI